MRSVKSSTSEKPSQPVTDGNNSIEISNYLSSPVAVPSSSSQHSVTAKDDVPTSTEPALPFSCTPVYVFIIIAIFFVLVIGAVTTVIDMRPEFLYGSRMSVNESIFSNVTGPL